MKIRSCFVANSSSSSFIIIGKKFTNEEAKQYLLNRLKEVYPDFKEKYQKFYKDYDSWDEYAKDCCPEELASSFDNLTAFTESYGNSVFIGKNIKCGDNVVSTSIKQLEEKIAEAKELFGDDICLFTGEYEC